MTNLDRNSMNTAQAQPAPNSAKAPWHAPRLMALDLSATAGGPVPNESDATQPDFGAS